MSTPFRLGLVGAGGIAQAYVQLSAQRDDFCLAVVAEPDESRRRQAAEATGARGVTDVEAITASEVDGVVVCTPPATHATIAAHLLARGVPVLCEKPLAVTGIEARSLVDDARERAIPLMMAAKYRYVDEVVSLRDLVATGGLGSIVSAMVVFSGRVSAAGRWQSDRALSGGGVIIDNGIHGVDLLRFVLGPAIEVLAVEGPRVQDLPVEDTATIFVRTADGALGEVQLTWSADLRADNYLLVRGTDAVAELGWKQSRLAPTGGDWRHFGDGYKKLDAMGGALREFVRLVDAGTAPRISLDDAVGDAYVIDAAYASIAAGGAWTKVDA